MDHILLGMQGTKLFVYLDDIIKYAKTHEEHEDKVLRTYERLSKAGLRLQIDKCEFLTPEVTYLGHKIGSYDVRPDPGKVTAVANFPVPKSVAHIRQFLGLAGYYRRLGGIAFSTTFLPKAKNTEYTIPKVNFAEQ